MGKRKARQNYSVEQKAAILRRHLNDKVPVSDLCDEHGLQPSVFYSWKKALLDNAEVAIEESSGRRKRRSREAQLERQVETLKTKLAKKDNVIAEISEEYVALKKGSGGL